MEIMEGVGDGGGLSNLSRKTSLYLHYPYSLKLGPGSPALTASRRTRSRPLETDLTILICSLQFEQCHKVSISTVIF